MPSSSVLSSELFARSSSITFRKENQLIAANLVELKIYAARTLDKRSAKTVVEVINTSRRDLLTRDERSCDTHLRFVGLRFIIFGSFEQLLQKLGILIQNNVHFRRVAFAVQIEGIRECHFSYLNEFSSFSERKNT